MKAKEVKVGGEYIAKVSGQLCTIRIEAVNRTGGGWLATNLATRKRIQIKSAQRLRRAANSNEQDEPSSAPQSEPPTPVTTGECPRGGEHEWQENEGETTCRKCLEPKAAGKPKRQRKAKASTTDAGGEKKLSQIAAAAKVLALASEPMGAKEMVEAMATKGLWTSPGGKTPEATLYAAIMREINAKGDQARFAKAERGKFVANG